MLGEPVPSLLKNTTRNVTFDNVVLNGKPVKAEADLLVRPGGSTIERATYLPPN